MPNTSEETTKVLVNKVGKGDQRLSEQALELLQARSRQLKLEGREILKKSVYGLLQDED